MTIIFIKEFKLQFFLKGYKIECIGIPMHIDYFFDGGKKECTSESVREMNTYTSWILDYSVCDHNQNTHRKKTWLFIRKPISDGIENQGFCGWRLVIL